MSSSLPPPPELTAEQYAAVQQLLAAPEARLTVASPFMPVFEARSLGSGWAKIADETALSALHRPEEFTLYCPAHWTFAQANALLAPHGQRLAPIYPSDWQLVQAYAYGPPAENEGWQMPLRQSVLGLHWLNAKGEICGSGGQVLKNVTGYDIHRFMLGAQGLLGLPIALALRTEAVPEFPEKTYKRSVLFENATLKTRVEALLHQLYKAPPQGLRALDLEANAEGEVHLHVRWEGLPAVFDRCFGELEGLEESAEVSAAWLGDWVARYAMIVQLPLDLKKNGIFDTLQHLRQAYHPDALRVQGGGRSVWLAWGNGDDPASAKIFAAVGALPWRTPEALQPLGQAAWKRTLTPELWAQYARLREAWGLSPGQFRSAYLSALPHVDETV